MPHDLQPGLEKDIIVGTVSNLDGRTFLSGETTLHQDEKTTTSGVDSFPEMRDLIRMIILGPLHISQMLFYHRPDPMLVLKINPIVVFVANYLCLVLGYLSKFLYYKILTGWP